MHVSRAKSEEIRKFQGMEHRWRQADRGLIWCWERGRRMAKECPELAARAKDGELMVLGWRGGVSSELKMRRKQDGTLQYLAQWQGLAGKDLDIRFDEPTVLVCSSTGIEVTYSF